MTSNDARPFGCSGYTPFEEELVNAMRDFADKTNAPDFAPATIMRGARHRRSLVTAGIFAVLIVTGGGTALAVTHGSPASGYKPVTTRTPTPVATRRPTPVPTMTPTPVATSSPTPVPSGTATPVPTSTATPVSSVGPTPVPTMTPTPVATSSPTPVPSGTATPTPVSTRTPTPVATYEPTTTPTPS
jgi:hypothetical protein